jgi:hypothetical protein
MFDEIVIVFLCVFLIMTLNMLSVIMTLSFACYGGAEASKFALIRTTLARQMASSGNNMAVIMNTWEGGWAVL